MNAVESNGIENLKISGIGIKVNGIGIESQLKIHKPFNNYSDSESKSNIIKCCLFESNSYQFNIFLIFIDN